MREQGKKPEGFRSQSRDPTTTTGITRFFSDCGFIPFLLRFRESVGMISRVSGDKDCTMNQKAAGRAPVRETDGEPLPSSAPPCLPAGVAT